MILKAYIKKQLPIEHIIANKRSKNNNIAAALKYIYI